MKRIFISIIALLFAGVLQAQTASVVLGGLAIDPNSPLETSADTLSMDQAAGTAVFNGNVVIVQDTMRLKADRVELFNSDTDGLSRMLATGNVLLVTATEQAEAQRADYDVTNGKLVLSGDVLLSQQTNSFLSDTMNIDLNAGSATLSGNVRTVFNQNTSQ